MAGEGYFPPSENDGSWRVGDLHALGVDAGKLADAIRYHDSSILTTSHGGALVIVYKGHIIGETYTTGTEGGPGLRDSWGAEAGGVVQGEVERGEAFWQGEGVASAGLPQAARA